MERLVTGRPGTIRLNIFDEDGVAVDPLVAPTVTVRDGSGATVSTGSAVDSPVVVGLWTYAVPASVTAELDTYEATWSYTLSGAAITSVTTFEVCGGHLVEIADVRSFDPVLDDDATYTPAKIREARVRAEQRFENGAEVAFTTRARRVSLYGDDRPELLLPDHEVQEVLALEVNGVALDPADFILHGAKGTLESPNSAWSSDDLIDLYYLHGIAETPEPVRNAVKVLAVEYLIPSALPARATSQSTDLGEFRLSLARPDGTTGIPEVDSVMHDFGRRGPRIG